MTPRQARTEHRAAERKAKKLAYKAADNFAFSSRDDLPEASSGTANPAIGIPESPTRSEINRANAEHSTGPRTVVGKLASSGNSLKHGLASPRLIIPGESHAAFDALLTALLDEHQPANPTEELLVHQIAQSWWLTQRALRFQNDCFTTEGVDQKRLSLFLRYQTTHERAFHKALNTLIRLRKERARGFVSQTSEKAQSKPGFVSQNHADSTPLAPFTSQNRPSTSRIEAAAA